MMKQLEIKQLGKQHYQPVWQAMREFTDQRTNDTPDQIWLVEHHPVFTQGQAGKAEHLLNPKDIPVIQSDRGGQITYHGPGQIVIYTLLNLKRLTLNIRQLVTALEQSAIALLADYNITATANPKAPGVYINNEKICSVGLRVRKGCSYHGLAFNTNMDLSPFKQINPCGLKGITVTQLKHHHPNIDYSTVQSQLLQHLLIKLTLDEHIIEIKQNKNVEYVID